MAKHNELGQEKRFVTAFLPWLVTAAALAVYLLTLNHWVTFTSLPYVARASGWMWGPELTGPYSPFGPYSPVLYAVTYPFRLLPERWIPLALNLFSAVCGALTLGLLARSVALLPHDRTHPQRQREHGAFALLSVREAWIAPVLAAVVCGLQLSFWENATAICDNVFQVLLFAYIVRCLLEYRIDERDSWLFKATLVYGVAMSGNWLMIGLLPAFVASIVWIRGVNFFNLRFLRWLALCWVGGLLFYLLLPLLYVFSAHAQIGLWGALKLNLVLEKDLLKVYVVRVPRSVQLLLATTSILPLLLISIRWASHFGDPSRMGTTVTTGMLHLAHAALLLVCIWVAFDPVFSPAHQGIFIPELQYLGALCVGYFIGYFLLVFRPVANWMQRVPAGQVFMNRSSKSAVWGLLVLVPLGLVSKNLPQIRVTNGPAMKHYASMLTQNLPPQGLILCDAETTGRDNPLRLWLAQGQLVSEKKAANYVFADTTAMASPVYQELQQRRYGNRWPPLQFPKKLKQVPPLLLMRFVVNLSRQVPVYYLDPTFGYYMEIFYQQPHGMALELKPYPTNSISAPALTAAEISENDRFWKANQAAMESLVPWIQQPVSPDRSRAIRDWWMKKLHIPFTPNRTAVRLGRLYAHSLVFWATLTQRSGRWREAGRYFDLALALNPENLVARAGLQCNRELLAGKKPTVPPMQSLADEFAKHRNWEQLLRENGLFDDPTHCLIQSVVFTKGHLTREAAQQLQAVHGFDPDYLPATLALARFYSRRFPAKSLALLSEVRNHRQDYEKFGIHPRDVSITEAIALFASKRAPEAEQVLERAMQRSPRDQALLSAVVQVSTLFGRLTNALSAVERELVIAPTNTRALQVQGYLNLRLERYAAAIPPLTRVLTVQTNNQTARFNRAIAYLRNNQLAEAEHDYEILHKLFPDSFRIFYGLGEIAWREKDTNAAIRYYKLYLTNSIANSDEAKLVASRLKSLMANSN